MWTRVAIAVGMACVTGSWIGLDEPAVRPRPVSIQVSDATAADPGTGEAREPAESRGSGGEARPPQSPQRREKPRREDSLEIGIGEDDPEAGRTMLA